VTERSSANASGLRKSCEKRGARHLSVAAITLSPWIFWNSDRCSDFGDLRR